MRLHKFFQERYARLRKAGFTGCPPLRVTPGMWAELCREKVLHPAAALDPLDVHTCQGAHPIEVCRTDIRATGYKVVFGPREDLFAEVERDTGVELVSHANSVTSVPDNVACVEVLSVGELVTNVRAGDLVFIDFFDVSQGAILESEEVYMANCDAFKASYNPVSQAITPLDNYVITRRASHRMAVALTGTDRIEVPRSTLTSGIAGGKASNGDTATTVLYEEVVSVGRVTKRPRPGVMTVTEREVLDTFASGFPPNRDLLDDLRDERDRGYPADIMPGELAVFCQEMSTPIRVRGEFCHIVPYSEVEATVDDVYLLEKNTRAGKAGRLVAV